MWRSPPEYDTTTTCEIQETCFTPVVPTPCQMYQKSRAQLPLKQQQQQTTEKKLQQQQQVQQSPTFTKNHHLLLDLDIKTTNLKKPRPVKVT